MPEDADATDRAIGSRGCGVYTPTGAVGPQQRDEFPAESLCGVLSVSVWGTGLGRWASGVPLFEWLWAP